MCRCRKCWRLRHFDEDTVNELRIRAKNALLTMEIAKEESVEEATQDLRDMPGSDDRFDCQTGSGRRSYP